MTTLGLKFRVRKDLSQQFKTAVTTSYLHAALMKIAEKDNDYTKQSKGNPVNVYVVVFNISKNSKGPTLMLNRLRKLFQISGIDITHYYVG